MRLVITGLLAAGSIGCSAFWPTVVRTSPDEPLFHSGFPLVGGARLDSALCSLATVGPDATVLTSPPEPTDSAVDLARACRTPAPFVEPGHGRPGELVRVTGGADGIRGFLYRIRAPTGIVVVFSGMGMPAAGWVNERFAELAARRGWMVFALVRQEPRPIYFDPLKEARRGIEAADRVAQECGVPPSSELRILGVSLGGMEALLAKREALGRRSAKVAVLDALIDPLQATSNLDSFWHSVSVDSMQAYFRRILIGRYREKDPPPSFQEIMDRVNSQPGALTKVGADAPRQWLCKQPDPSAYAIFISDTDPVLGDGQGDFARECQFPLRRAKVPGHVPLACRLELFEEMLQALR